MSTAMRETPSPSAYASSSSGPHSSAFFTFEKQATSLGDLEIVRKIVEREGCLEALEQLLRTSASSSSSSSSAFRKTATRAPSSSEIEQIYPYTYPQRSIATTSPMVLQSLLEQLRAVSVQIVEAIEHWRARTQALVFQWRQINYLLKMTSDLDFLAALAPAVERVDALQSVRLERNPFLAALHLDHPALREKTPDAAVLLGLWVGNVDTRRVFACCKVLLRELEAEHKKRQLALGASDDDDDGGESFEDSRDPSRSATAVVDPSVLTASKHQSEHHPLGSASTRVRWSNQVVVHVTQTRTTSKAPRHLLTADAPRDRKEEMRRDVELSRELILHAEHELGAIREEVAILQERVVEALARPERRRQLQNKLGALVNALKFKSGDLFQRKNELRRKETVYRLACERGGSRLSLECSSSTGNLGSRVGASAAEGGHTAAAAALDTCEDTSPSSSPHLFLRSVESAMQEDELRRQEIVEKFMALAQTRAAAAAASTSRQKRKASPSKRSSSGTTYFQKDCALTGMTPDHVAAFVDSLSLGGGALGALFRAQGIDGALLQRATERDLEELGVTLRLHRVRILEAVAHYVTQGGAGAT